MFDSSRFIKRAAAKNRTETELSRRDETRRDDEERVTGVVFYPMVYNACTNYLASACNISLQRPNLRLRGGPSTQATQPVRAPRSCHTLARACMTVRAF